MAISSPPLPSLSSLSTLFSQERSRRIPKIQLKTSHHSQAFSDTQLSIKRQNHLYGKVSHTKFYGDFCANKSNGVNVKVRVPEKPNSQILVSQELEPNQIQSAHLSGNGNITGEDPWWYRLPCVLGILLSGGENEDAPGGLYSLELEPNSTDRNPMSYAITFEDRVDATNFCYVLDTFFEDLNDVSAEIIPFTVQELKEEVHSGRLNVLVIPKGKLKLYGSQTLEEVETELRSLLS